MQRVVVGAALLAWMPFAALADSPPVDIGAPTVLTLALEGTVPTHCGFKSAPTDIATLTSLELSGTLEIPFTLDCNSTFDIRVALPTAA